MSFVMFIHLLLQLIAGLHVAAPVAQVPQQHVSHHATTPAPVVTSTTTPAPVVTPTPTPAPAVEQPQLPDEVVGRQVDGPNGENCTVVDMIDKTICTAPETECLNGEEWQGDFGCVATQLPEETIGRQDN